ncbi:hypothetical protein TNCV_3697821 [Trichonephila clavipes]|uniref:Uncharacterized protein n=1 Tax=Trichonephila clavipes TaxID=2585209 RepID=A0A8X6SEB0_TRICX|nr:hypothetical protein TNCV_3697821 [Trichonephila clavipes]
MLSSKSLDTLRENCGIIRKQASTDGGVLWEVGNLEGFRKPNSSPERSLRNPCLGDSPEQFMNSQVCSTGGRKTWNENNNHGLLSSSETQSVTDSDIAMPIRYTLLDSGFTLEDSAHEWEEKKQKILKEFKLARYFSLIIDSTPDSSHTNQLAVASRYVSVSKASANEKAL